MCGREGGGIQTGGLKRQSGFYYWKVEGDTGGGGRDDENSEGGDNKDYVRGWGKLGRGRKLDQTNKGEEGGQWNNFINFI